MGQQRWRRGDDNSSSNGASMSQRQSHSVLSQSLARTPMAWGGRGKSHPRSLLSESLLGTQPISSIRRLRHMGEEEVGEETTGEAGWWQE